MVFTCVCFHLCVCVCVFTRVFKSVCSFLCVYLCVDLCFIHVFLPFCRFLTCVFAGLFLHVCLYLFVCVYMCMCLHVCINFCVFIYLCVSVLMCEGLCLHVCVCMWMCHFFFVLAYIWVFLIECFYCVSWVEWKHRESSACPVVLLDQLLLQAGSCRSFSAAIPAAATSLLAVSDKEAAIYPVITGSKAALFGHRHDAAGVSTVNEQLQSPIRSDAIRPERSRWANSRAAFKTRLSNLVNGDELDFGVHRQAGPNVHEEWNATPSQTGLHWFITMTLLVRSFMSGSDKRLGWFFAEGLRMSAADGLRWCWGRVASRVTGSLPPQPPTQCFTWTVSEEETNKCHTVLTAPHCCDLSLAQTRTVSYDLTSADTKHTPPAGEATSAAALQLNQMCPSVTWINTGKEAGPDRVSGPVLKIQVYLKQFDCGENI